MKNILIKPFIVLAAAGLILSIIVHLIALSGGKVPFENLSWGLHAGIFVVWLPAILTAQKLTKDFTRNDFWKAALRGCPTWMRRMTYFFFGYAIINFAIFMISMTATTKGTATSTETDLRGFSGPWMAFYSAALAM